VVEREGGRVISTGLLATALVCTALAQYSYKLYFVRHRPGPLLLRALALFAIAQIGFFAALTRLEVGTVYMSVGVVQILVLALSRYGLGEDVNRHHLTAVILIVGGLVLYAA